MITRLCTLCSTVPTRIELLETPARTVQRSTRHAVHMTTSGGAWGMVQRTRSHGHDRGQRRNTRTEQIHVCGLAQRPYPPCMRGVQPSEVQKDCDNDGRSGCLGERQRTVCARPAGRAAARHRHSPPTGASLSSFRSCPPFDGAKSGRTRCARGPSASLPRTVRSPA